MSLPPFVIPVRDVFVYAYLIVEPTQLTLIDCGLPGSFRKISRVILTANKQLSDLIAILLTHSDGDHTGSLNQLKKVSNAAVYASQIEAEAIRKGVASRELTPKGIEILLYNVVGKMFSNQPAPVDHILTDGDILPVCGGLQVLATPGHTPGHLSYYLPGEHILFSGDSILTGSPNRPSHGANTWNEAIAQESFNLQMALNPRWICGGHGIHEIID